MINYAPHWAVLRIHDEPVPDAEPVIMADKAHGPYATERAALMVARGLNVDGSAAPARFVPVMVAPVDGWTWDGPTAPVMVGGSEDSKDCISQPRPVDLAVPEPWASMIPDPHPRANCGPLALALAAGDRCPTCGTVIST